VSEDRLLQSFCALLGAIVLVATVHVFLLATSAPRLEREPALKTASLPEAAPLAPVAAPVAPEIKAAEVAPDTRAELVAARAEAKTLSQQAEAAFVAPAAGAEIAAQQAESANATAPASPEAVLPAAEEAQAAPPSDTAQGLAAIAEPVPTEAETKAAALLEAAATDHAFVSEPSDPDAVAAAQDAEAIAAAPIAEAATVEQEPSSLAAAASLEELIARTMASEEAPVDLAAATDLDEAASPAPSAVQAFEADPDVTGAVDALPEITIPLRKPQAPSAEPASVKTAEDAATANPREQPERRQAASARADANSDANAKKPLWKPMTLGFGKDRKRPPEPKPAKENSAPQVAPAKAKAVSSGAYRAQVWGKLARHKPRLGKPGSATVVFAIGPSGALRSARVGRSSGNAALDQRALAAVRAAAPFPAPPGGMSASALTFSIQIYFR
jgi:periplasmic protein TonB